MSQVLAHNHPSSYVLPANLNYYIGIKQHHNAVTKKPFLTSETTPNPDATTGASATRGETPVQQDPSSGRVSLAADNDEQDIRQALHLHPELNCSVTDIASTTGLIRTNSLSGSLWASNRTNTFGVEEGSHVSMALQHIHFLGHHRLAG